ncbi:MAG: hypothetical protein V9F01_18275 [Chitinophagaceae bacterium]
MKKIIYLVVLSFITTMAGAQQNWDVCVQKKPVLKKVEENKEKNVVTIKRTSLGNKTSLTIKFNDADTANNITLMVDKEAGGGLTSWEFTGKPITISGKELKKLFTGENKLIFTYSAIPKDPNLAMLVRVRPVHVCTVELY